MYETAHPCYIKKNLITRRTDQMFAVSARFPPRSAFTDEPDSQRPGESESWSYPTACSGPWQELRRVGRTVVALGLLLPIGPVSTLAIRRTRLRLGPVGLGVVPCWHCRAGSGD